MGESASGLVEAYVSALESRDWSRVHDLLHPDVVYELPQSRERIVGRDAYVLFNQEYPGEWHIVPRMIIDDGVHGAAWFDWQLDGERGDGTAFFELEAGAIARVTDFWPEPYDPPPGREHLTESMDP